MGSLWDILIGWGPRDVAAAGAADAVDAADADDDADDNVVEAAETVVAEGYRCLG